MEFTRISLESFKCFVDETIDLTGGVTAMHGANGAGKTTILEACFFALYGADVPDVNLTDVIEKGTDEAVVELWFTHLGEEYYIHRRVREYSSQTTHDVELRTPKATIEGPGDVADAIESLFRLDANAFLNCAYVRQGEINKLIGASASERQNMIDSLLQLGKLDDYEDRMTITRNGVRSIKDAKAGELKNVEGDIADLVERDLEEQLGRIVAELDGLNDEIDEIDDDIETVTEEQRDATSELEEIEELEERIDDLEQEVGEADEKVGELKDRKEGLESDREAAAERLDELETEAEHKLEDTSVEELDGDAVEARLEDVMERHGRIESALVEAQEQVSRFEEAVAHARDEASDLDDEASGLEADAEGRRGEARGLEEDLADPRSRLDEVEEEMDEIESSFDESATTRDEVEAFVESKNEQLEAAERRYGEIRDERSGVKKRIEDAEELLEEGLCPECGQEVHGAPSVSNLEDDRETLEELEDDLSEAEDTVEEREEAVRTARDLEQQVSRYEELEERRGDLNREIEASEQRIESIRNEADELDAEAAAVRERAGFHRAAIPHLEARKERDDRAQAYLENEAYQLHREWLALEAADEALGEAEQKRDEHERLGERLTDDVEPQIEHWEDERDELEGELDDARAELDPSRVDRLERRREGAARWRDVLERRRERLGDDRTELQSEKGGVENQLEELGRKREQRDALETQVDRLAAAVQQCDDVEQMYRELREDLRTRNVDELERLLNELFDLLYQTDSYEHFELSDSYELTVYEKSGEALDPTDLSGGERALFNLALRCAIYQLLTEGLSGQAPLPPLILDEPTVYLDSQHVNELKSLISRMEELGVDQIIVVSHEDGLLNQVGERVEIQQDSSTNRSHATTESRDLLTSGLEE